MQHGLLRHPRSPDGGHLIYSSAGHPPGIVAQPDGRAELLDQGRSVALAVQARDHRRDAESTLSRPATGDLMLYTDGLVERRRRGPWIRHRAGRGDPLAAGTRCPYLSWRCQIMAGLAPPGGYEDDVALLLYRYPGPLELTFPAHLRSVRSGPGLASALAQPVRPRWVRAARTSWSPRGRRAPTRSSTAGEGAGGQITLTAAVTATDLNLTVRTAAGGRTLFRVTLTGTAAMAFRSCAPDEAR